MHGALLHVEGVDAEELEVQPIAARRATAEVWEDKERTGCAALVFCLVRAGHERSHQSAGRLHVGGAGGRLGRFVLLVGGVEEGAVQR